MLKVEMFLCIQTKTVSDFNETLVKHNIFGTFCVSTLKKTLQLNAFGDAVITTTTIQQIIVNPACF